MADRPLIIGVVGGSGSGKTTVTRSIYAMPGVDAAFIDQDAYYRDLAHLPLEERKLVNFDHPESFDTPLLVDHLAALQRGEPIAKPTYDYAAHTRAARTEPVEPKEVILVDVSEDVRFIRRLQRDTAERGRSVDDVIRQYMATVRPMHLEFVEPTKRYADIIIPEGGFNRIGIEMIQARVALEISRRRAAGGEKRRSTD